MFSNIQNGAKASAMYYSIIETAKANGIEPYVYLRALFTQLPSCKTVEDYESLYRGILNLVLILKNRWGCWIAYY